MQHISTSSTRSSVSTLRLYAWSCVLSTTCSTRRKHEDAALFFKKRCSQERLCYEHTPLIPLQKQHAYCQRTSALVVVERMRDICGREAHVRTVAPCTLLHSRSGTAVHFPTQDPWQAAAGVGCRSTAHAPGSYLGEVGGAGAPGDAPTSCRIRLGLRPQTAASCRKEQPTW